LKKKTLTKLLYSTFLIPDDIHIGCRMKIHGHDFEITGADERVRKYLDEVNHPIPKHTEASLRQYFYGKID